MAFGRVVELIETKPFVCELIEVRCLDFRSVTTKIGESEIVRHDQHNIWLRLGGRTQRNASQYERADAEKTLESHADLVMEWKQEGTFQNARSPPGVLYSTQELGQVEHSRRHATADHVLKTQYSLRYLTLAFGPSELRESRKKRPTGPKRVVNIV